MNTTSRRQVRGRPSRAARVGVPSTRHVLDRLAVFRDLVRAEKWDALAKHGSATLALGHVALRSLDRRGRTEAEQRATVDEAMGRMAGQLRTLAESEAERAIFSAVAERLKRERPGVFDRVGPSLEKLAAGETRGVDVLERLERRASREREEPSMELDGEVAIAATTRGLLGVAHANFNRAWAELDSSQPGEGEAAEEPLEEPIRHVVAGFSRRLEALQRGIYAALVQGGRDDAAMRCRHLAASLEVELPLFVWDLAEGRARCDAARRDGRGTHAEALGRELAEAGRLTREAIASHAAALALVPELERDASSLHRKGSVGDADRVAFRVAEPNAVDVPIPKLNDRDEGDEVEIRGFVGELHVGKDRHDKLIARARLDDPSSGTSAWIRAWFVHFGHEGLAIGSPCRARGTLTKDDDGPLVDVARRPEAELAEASWHQRFVRSAVPWFEVYPNGHDLAYAWAPHRTDREERSGGEGAAELIYAPFVRSRVQR